MNFGTNRSNHAYRIQLATYVLGVSALLTLPLGPTFRAHAADSKENILRPFTTDGCSTSPDNAWIGNNSWLNCCVEHDKAYWLGGTAAEKDLADSSLKNCLLDAGMDEIRAEIYYRSVQVGGSAHLPTSWKWGYGWKKPRGYAPVTEADRRQAARFARLLDLPKKIVTPIYKINEALTTKNYCKEDLIRRIVAQAGLQSSEDLFIVRVDARGGTDAWQVFTPECPGGYYYGEFKPSLAGDRCLLHSYPSMPDQLQRLEAFGDCRWKSAHKTGAGSSDVAVPTDPRLTGRGSRKSGAAESTSEHVTKTSEPRSDAVSQTGSAGRGE